MSSKPILLQSSNVGAPECFQDELRDSCPACHANCGCHQAINLEGSGWIPITSTGRPSYVTEYVAITFIAADRLPRPPRA